MGKTGGIFINFSRKGEALFLGISRHCLNELDYIRRGGEKQLGIKQRRRMQEAVGGSNSCGQRRDSVEISLICLSEELSFHLSPVCILTPTWLTPNKHGSEVTSP